jgi:C4-dicarboxylate-specific signal transduction histidine kinase
MTADADRSGLQFFGRMCASISHDIKNVLAVVNENAGLLEDLCAMADRGRPIDPARLKRLAVDVRAQVRRGDGIATVLNRFAHSVDAGAAQIDPAEILDLLEALSRRSVSMRGLSLKVNRPVSTPAVTISPFLLLNLLWLCLEHATAAVGPERKLEVSAVPAEAGVRFRFRGLKGAGDDTAAPFADEPVRGLCRTLRAVVHADLPDGELSVTLFQQETRHE